MRHKIKGRRFKRRKGPRKALIRSLVCSLIKYEKIKTTKEKAKEIRPIIEKLITKAKKNNFSQNRQIRASLDNKEAYKHLTRDLFKRYTDRQGGYTRIIKIGKRLGDQAEIVQIEFV